MRGFFRAGISQKYCPGNSMKKKSKRTSVRPKHSNLKSAQPHKPLRPEELRWQCKPETLNVKTTDDVHPAREIIGQERALRALRVGLAMKHFGYNIFVTGVSGTGRTTTIKRMLHEFEMKGDGLRDHCYVFNFKNTDQPIALSLPAGQGKGLKIDMASFIADLQRDIPSIYEGQR